jgi:hypothetical protein
MPASIGSILRTRHVRRFETAVVMKSTIFWDITSCSPLSVNRRFGETYRLRLQGLLANCFHAGFLLSLFFELEGVGEMLLRNVG